MTTQTRKQREIREREQEILSVARGMLLKNGYLGLNMDRIAEAVEYSKGTVYNHFGSKEDLIGALMVETMNRRAELFRRAVAFPGRPRERICAVGIADQLFFRIDPDHFRIEQLVAGAGLSSKISEKRHQELLTLHQQLLAGLESIVTDAIEAGDLPMRAEIPPKVILFGLWSMAMGSQYIASDAFGRSSMDDLDLAAARWTNFGTLLDGYCWKPMLADWDYDETARRVEKEVFADESKLAANN